MSARVFKRANARAAYDSLSSTWRKEKIRQAEMLRLGLLQEAGTPIGRKPPFSAFLSLVEDVDPREAVKSSSPSEFVEMAKAMNVDWRGRDVTLKPVFDGEYGERGVVEIPIMGDKEDD